jgi:excisionase family DNA binding protein
MDADIAIIGNTVTMSLDKLETIISEAVSKSTSIAIDKFEELKLKNQSYSTPEAGKYLNVSSDTIKRWINDGVKIQGIIHYLPAIQNGRNYTINGYDLKCFKEKLKVKKQY